MPGAFARMYLKNPGNGNELPNFPPDEVKDDEFFVEARTNSVGANTINVKVQLNNRSAWPARSSTTLTARYFFTLDPSVSLGSVIVTPVAGIVNTNTEFSTVSAPVLYFGNIYYVTIGFSGTQIFPGGLKFSTNHPDNVHWMREANFTISGPSAWDNTNDWSYNGIGTLSTTTLTKTKQIPVYENTGMIFGTLPMTPLPVNLFSFTAMPENNRVKIEWATALEVNNSHFDIERSENGIKYYKIATLTGKGNTNAKQNYMLYDENPINGNNYYRLKQYDMNDKMTLLGVRMVNFDLSDLSKASVYPNPASDGIYVTLSKSAAKEVYMTLTSLSGAIVHKEVAITNSGLANYRLALKQKLAAGQYMLHLRGNGLNQTIKVIIL